MLTGKAGALPSGFHSPAMKLSAIALLSLCLGVGLAGCGHLDLTPPAAADRVLSGTVTNNSMTELPPGTEVTVRIVDLSRGEGKGEVLGEDTIVNPPRMPVPFRIEYRAEDAVLLRSVNVEARVSVDGRLRYTTISGHPITLGNVNDRHVLEVSLAGRR